MGIEEGAGKRGRQICERNADATGLPKYACFLGKGPRAAPKTPTGFYERPDCDLYEFEVVTATAAYNKGERFYLTPAQAERAYFWRS